ncbi:MAG: hypothetical protein KKC20_12625 [Proteobacteria bacterium]|nr:hypothetical protein [Pseudomonadota bacterium]
MISPTWCSSLLEKKSKETGTLNSPTLALKKTKGKVHGDCGAAAMLKMNSITLRNKMKKLGICFGRKARIRQ